MPLKRFASLKWLALPLVAAAVACGGASDPTDNSTSTKEAIVGNPTCVPGDPACCLPGDPGGFDPSAQHCYMPTPEAPPKAPPGGPPPPVSRVGAL